MKLFKALISTKLPGTNKQIYQINLSGYYQNIKHQPVTSFGLDAVIMYFVISPYTSRSKYIFTTYIKSK